MIDDHKPDQIQKVKTTDKQKARISLLLAITILLACTLAPAVAAAPVGTSPTKVVAIAASWIGVKNEHNGNSRAGIDCSHLVYQVYRAAGAKSYYFMKVPAMRSNTYFKTVKTPALGDVVFFKKDVTYNGKKYGLTSHVGIYIGNSKMIDTAFSTKGTVMINDLKKSPFKDGSPYYAQWTKK